LKTSYPWTISCCGVGIISRLFNEKKTFRFLKTGHFSGKFSNTPVVTAAHTKLHIVDPTYAFCGIYNNTRPPGPSLRHPRRPNIIVTQYTRITTCSVVTAGPVFAILMFNLFKSLQILRRLDVAPGTSRAREREIRRNIKNVA